LLTGSRTKKLMLHHRRLGISPDPEGIIQLYFLVYLILARIAKKKEAEDILLLPFMFTNRFHMFLQADKDRIEYFHHFRDPFV
jgi:hypothetical protein